MNSKYAIIVLVVCLFMVQVHSGVKKEQLKNKNKKKSKNFNGKNKPGGLGASGASAIVSETDKIKTSTTTEWPPFLAIVGGSEALPGQFPYQVVIFGDIYFLCGGSLISKRYVLTAAHCVAGRTFFEVRLGCINWQLPDSAEPNRVTMNSTIKIVHENYTATNLRNDIALIYLPSDAPLNGYINTIKLPSFSDVTKTFENAVGTVSGWGRTYDISPASAILMWVDLIIISNTDCMLSYYQFLPLIVNSTICTSGANAQSTCRGDSGGPLTVYDNSIKKLVGIVSFGRGLCEVGYAQGFTRVTSYLTWISSKTGITIDP